MADNNKAMSLDNTKRYIKGLLQGWFSNKATLDALSTGANGDLLYNNQPINTGGSSITVDAALSSTSENPVQNKAIYAALQSAGTGIGCDDAPMSQIIQMLIDIFGDDGSAGVKIVSFASGTDQELADMLAAHYAGTINIHDYWSVGDTRTISLAAMQATGVSESHAAQDVEIVLVNSGGYTTSDNKECAFVWQQKDGLAEPGYMNSTATNANGWSGSARRTWCSSVYKQALPSSFRDMLKTCTIRTAQPNQNGVLYTDTQDDIFLPSMTEVYGTITDSSNPNITWTNGYEGNKWDYYNTDQNAHDKKMGSVGSDSSTRLFYWLRSPDRSNATSFMRVPAWWPNPSTPKGSQANTVDASTSQYQYHYAIVPCGFI